MLPLLFLFLLMPKESPLNGETVVFQAVATDDNNDAADLEMVWYIGATTVCEAAPVDDNGMQECSVTLTEGMSSIVAEVRDPSNAAGRFELAFFIDTNIAPQAQIVSPTAASVFYANQVVSFEGMVFG